MERITEREWETQCERFSHATYEDLLRIGKSDFARLPAVLHMKNENLDPQGLFKMALMLMITSGSAGCANGRPVNDPEKRFFKELLGAFFAGFPSEKADSFAAGMAESFEGKLAPQAKELLRAGGLVLAPIFLDLALCFAWVDGEVNDADRASLSSLLQLVNETLEAIRN